jgi:hypothetical protein
LESISAGETSLPLPRESLGVESKSSLLGTDLVESEPTFNPNARALRAPRFANATLDGCSEGFLGGSVGFKNG